MGKRTLSIGVIVVLCAAGCQKEPAPEEQLAARMAENRRERAEAERAAIAERNADAEAEVKKQQALAKEQSDKVNALLGQLASAKDDATKARLQKQLEEEKAKQDEMALGRRGRGVPPARCQPGDPLCTDPQ